METRNSTHAMKYAIGICARNVSPATTKTVNTTTQCIFNTTNHSVMPYSTKSNVIDAREIWGSMKLNVGSSDATFVKLTCVGNV